MENTTQEITKEESKKLLNKFLEYEEKRERIRLSKRDTHIQYSFMNDYIQKYVAFHKESFYIIVYGVYELGLYSREPSIPIVLNPKELDNYSTSILALIKEKIYPYTKQKNTIASSKKPVEWYDYGW